MNFLEELGYKPLNDLLKTYENIGINDFTSTIYYKHDEEFEISSFENHLKINELINMAVNIVFQKDPKNVFCVGYNRNTSNLQSSNLKGYWKYANTTTNFFKTIEWANLFKVLGDQFSLYLLTKCSIIQVKDNKNVLLVGNHRKLCDNYFPKKQESIKRNMLFQKIIKKHKIDYEKMIMEVLGIDMAKDIQKVEKNKYILDILKKTVESMNHIKMYAIYKNYFKDEISLENKKEILQCSVDPDKIINFLFCLSKKLFKSIFNLTNFRILKSKLNIFIKQNKYETINKTELLKYFYINKFKIFKNQKCPRQQYIKRTKIVSNLLMFLFNEFYIPTLSIYFYSTEVSFAGYKVFYFTRNCWNHFSGRFIVEFFEQFEEIKSKHSVRAGIRCIPKKSGFRMIVNMKKKFGTKKPLNKELEPILTVLKHEKKHELLNSVLGFEAGCIKIKNYMLENHNSDNYILKVDLKGCFDNIPHNILEEIYRQLFKKEKYIIRKYYILEKNAGTLKWKLHSKCVKSSTPFINLVNNKKLNSNQIIADYVYEETKTRDEMIFEIHSLITKNVIMYKNKYFLQKKGIPQGSVLSSMLCSLYYTEFDKLYFNKIITKGILVRYTDDFLIITPSIEEIIDFLKVSAILKEKGMIINAEKVESNFKIEDIFNTKQLYESYVKNDDKFYDMVSQCKPERRNINWCGFVIASHGFGVKKFYKLDYFKYNIAYKNHTPGNNILNQIKKSLKMKISSIIFDLRNSLVFQNLFDTFINIARKMFHYFKRAGFINVNFFAKIYFFMIQLTYQRSIEYNVNISKSKIKKIAISALEASKAEYGLDELLITRYLKKD